MLLFKNFATLVGLLFGWLIFSLSSLLIVSLAYGMFGVFGLVGSVIALFLLASALAERLL